MLELLNTGSHGVLIIVIFYLIRVNAQLIAENRKLINVIIQLRLSFEEELAATGGLPSRKK